MTDGLGSVTYEYDNLSRMTAEVRDFTDTLSNAPNNGLFRLEYTYTLGGQLKSLKDPYGDRVDYAYDKVARLSALTGTTFGGVATYASNPAYRAWGGLKSLSYGNGTSMNVGFDARLRPTEFEMVKTGQSTPIMEKTYDYYSDGRLRKLDDAVDDRFDRVNSYDQLGRVTSSKTGLVARGGTPTGQQVNDIPYIQSYEYNGFGNTLERENNMWGTNNFSAERTFVNNRIQNQSQNVWEYDADGRMTFNASGTTSTFDAAGRLVVYSRSTGADINEVTRHYTGDGLEAKRTQRNFREVEPEEWDWEQQPTYYYIRSTVLGGQVVSDVYETGTKKRTYVRAGGEEIAWQNGDSGGSVVFQAADAAGMSLRSAEPNGDIFDAQGSESSPAELDPLGNNVGQENPFVVTSGGSSCVGCGMLDETMPRWAAGGHPRSTLNGFPISHEEAAMMADNGTLVGEIVHAARGRIHIFRNVPVGGILGNLVMPSRYILIPTETLQRDIAFTDFRIETLNGWPRKQDSYNKLPNCFSFYQLLYEFEPVRRWMNEAWERTANSAEQVYRDNRMGGRWEDRWAGAEHGFILAYDQDKNTVWSWQIEGTEPPKKGSSPGIYNLPEQIRQFEESLKASKITARILLVVHTHPPNGPFQKPGPYANTAQLEALQTWHPAAVTGYSRNPSGDDLQSIAGQSYLGVVVWGQDKFTVYGSDYTNDATLKRKCIGQ